MAELDLRRSPWNDGIGISGDFLDRQLYLLGCMVHASAAFEKLDDHALRDLRQQFQEAEIGRLLLTIAAAVRNAMDQNPSRSEYWLRELDINVGILERSKDTAIPKDTLDFREACNKLIHCLSINFDYDTDQPRRGMALRHFVHLYGFHGKQNWKATIDINRFIEVAAQLT